MSTYKIDPALEEQLKKRGMTSNLSNLQSATEKTSVLSNIGEGFKTAVKKTANVVKGAANVVGDITGITTLKNAYGGAMAAGYVNKFQRELDRTSVSQAALIHSQLQNPNIPKERKLVLQKLLASQDSSIADGIPELQVTDKQILGASANLALTIATLGKSPMSLEARATGQFKSGLMSKNVITELSAFDKATKGLTAAARVAKYGYIGKAANALTKFGPQVAYDALLGTAYGAADAFGKNKSIEDVKKEAVTMGVVNAAAPVVGGLVLRGLGQSLKYTGKGIAGVTTAMRDAAEKYALGTTVEQRIAESKTLADEALSIYEPVKTAGQKAATKFVNAIDYIKDLPQKLFDAGKPLDKYSREAYLEYRLGNDAARAKATDAKYTIANDIFSKDAEVFKQTKAKMALLDQLDRARLGDKTVLDGGDVSLIEDRLAKLEIQHGDLGINETVQKSIDDFNDFNKQILQEKVDAGLISKEAMDKLTETHPNYIPHSVMARTLDESTPMFSAGSRNPSKSTVVASAGGSEKALEDPIQTIFDRLDAHYKAVSNSKLTDSLVKDAPEGLFTPVRTEDNVAERKAIIADMASTKKEISKLASGLKESNLYKSTIGKTIKTLSTEADQLTKYLEDKFTIKMSDAGEFLDLSKQEFDDVSKRIIQLKDDIKNIGDTKVPSVNDSINYLGDKLQGIHDTNASNYAKVTKELADLKISPLDLKEKGLATINRWTNGVKETYLVPQEVAVAVKNLNQEALTGVVKGWGAVNNVFKKLTTGYNLPFALSNKAKDVQTAYVTADVLIDKYLKDAGLPRDFRKTLDLTEKGLTDLYRRVGGSGADIYTESGMKEATKTFDEMRKSGFAKIVDNSYRPDKWVATINSELEKSTRLDVFKKALQSGVSPQEAALIARDATVDFSKMGTQMKALNQIFPFLNARVQGASNMFNVAGAAPDIFARKMYYSSVVPTVLLDQYNSQFASNLNVNANISDNYWYFITGEEDVTDKDGRKIKIPNVVALKKGEMQQVGSIAISELLRRARNEDPKSAQEISYKILGSISPIGTGGYNPSSWWTAPIAAAGPIGKISVGMGTNVDPYTGLSIVPDSKKVNSPYLQYTDNNKQISKEIGATLNVSPAKLEFIINSFGAVPKQATQIADVTEGAIKGEGIRSNALSDSQFSNAANLPWVDNFLKQGAYIGSEDYKKGTKLEQTVKTKEADISVKNKETANLIVDNAYKISNLDQRKAYLSQAKKDYPDSVFSKVKTEYKARNAEGYLRPGMDTAVVAQFVYQDLMEMGKSNFTTDEKKEYLKNLIDKGIVTKEATKEVKGLSQYGVYIDEIENAKTQDAKNSNILSAIKQMNDEGIDKKYMNMFLDKVYNDGFITPESKLIIKAGLSEIFKK